MTQPTDADAMAAREQVVAACETLQRLLLALLDAKTKVATQIHAIRKRGKSLRGGMEAFGLRQSAARSIQAVNRLLSGTRDTTARSNSWRQLAWTGDPAITAAISSLLDQQSRAGNRRPPPAAIHWCIELVDTARDELLRLPDGSLAATMAKGLQELQRRTRKRCHALNQSKPDFHAARKAVKAWLGASGFLPTTLARPDKPLETFAQLLGDENDMTVLAEWLRAHGFTRAMVPTLWQALKKARRQIQRQVLREAAVMADVDCA